MSWDSEPATEKQLNYLKLFGYEPDQPLTKQVAHDLIDKFEEDPERRRIRGENQARESAVYEKERRENLAYYLHTDCDTLAKALANASDKEDRFYAKDELKLKQDERIEFWKDTFRDVGDRKGESLQACPLFQRSGIPKTGHTSGTTTSSMLKLNSSPDLRALYRASLNILYSRVFVFPWVRRLSPVTSLRRQPQLRVFDLRLEPPTSTSLPQSHEHRYRTS